MHRSLPDFPRALCAVAAAAVLAQSASAQAAPAEADAAKKETEKKVETVTVTGARDPSRIDRDVYDPKADPDTATSSAADALNKAPGVNVDAEGNVSLRGNSNVQVLIDGRSSAMMQGEMRGATLQSLSASDIDSVEVMNNPGAQFSAEGSGGIINLVMKRNRKPGKTLSVNAGAGTQSSWNGSVASGITSAKGSFSAGVFTRHDPTDTVSSSLQQRFDASGLAQSSATQSNGDGTRTILGVNAAGDYFLTDDDTIGLQMQAFRYDGELLQTRLARDTSPAGALTRAYTSLQDQELLRQSRQVKFTFDHQGDTPGESLKGDVRFSTGHVGDNRLTRLDTQTGPGGRTQSLQRRDDEVNRAGTSLDYKRRIAGGLFNTGLQIEQTENIFDTDAFETDLVSGLSAPNARRTSLFTLNQNQYEGYATFQFAPTSKLALLPGLRIEHTETEISSPTLNTAADNAYTRFHPSLTMNYQLTEKGVLTFAYTNRVRRPEASALNPAIVFSDERTASAGNPNLKPQATQGVEAGYEWRDKGTSYSLKAFYRADEDSFTEDSRLLADGVLLTTRANGGRGNQTGLELAFARPLAKWMDIDVRTTLSQAEVSTVRNGAPLDFDASAVGGRARLRLKPSPNDQLQFSVNASGKQLTGEGFVEPDISADASFRHKFSSRFALSVSVRDVFDSSERTRIIDTPDLFETSTSQRLGRVVSVGLSFTPFVKPGSKEDLEGPPERRYGPSGESRGGSGGGGGGSGGSWGGGG